VYSTSFGCAITGGYVYRGARLQALRGTYFFADYSCTAAVSPIWSLRFVNGLPTDLQTRTTQLAPGAGLDIRSLTSFGEDYYGEIYMVDQEGGEVFKIVPKCPADLLFNNAVDVDDLIGVILGWGPCAAVPAACPADVVQNGAVDVDDLIFIILSWGACPP
jgi:hypothetical protein